MTKQKFLKTDQNGEYVDRVDNYVRIGADYFRIIQKTDRFGMTRTELKVWKKDEIKTDFGKDVFGAIRKFADFTMMPDNVNYKPFLANLYNLYKPFSHKPKPGSIKWSEILMHHIFGEQYHLGMRYLQMLYLHPCRMAPVLVLVSKDRQTGKTTFVNWLNMIFGANMVVISPEDLQSQFNLAYSTSNIIAVEETLIEKAITVEKIKSLATGKFITVNQKFVNHYSLPFFGKIIMTSNNEDKFARIDEEEIRFFIRKVPLPTIFNHDIETNLAQEIPAFLHHLTTLPPIDFTVDRSGFTPLELINASLESVKRESKSWLYKSLRIMIEDLFLNELKDVSEFMADSMNIKKKFFEHDSRVDLAFIRDTMKKDFNLKLPEKTEYFIPFTNGEPKSSRPYLFKREQFTKETVPVQDLTDEPPF